MSKTPSIYSDEFWQEAKMSEMVERMAQFGMRDPEIQRLYPWENLSEETKDFHRRTARVAIEAMKVPTADMVEAYVLTTGHEFYFEGWTAAIEAALK